MGFLLFFVGVDTLQRFWSVQYHTPDYEHDDL